MTLKIPRVLAGRLRALARRKGRSQAALLREGLELRLAREGSAAASSVLDLVDDLAGSLDGPRDLGSKSKHLRGFGK